MCYSVVGIMKNLAAILKKKWSSSWILSGLYSVLFSDTVRGVNCKISCLNSQLTYYDIKFWYLLATILDKKDRHLEKNGRHLEFLSALYFS